MTVNLTSHSQQRNFTAVECKLSKELIAKVAGTSQKYRYDDVQRLDLHIREESQGEIVLIENLEMCPNLKLLNLSYNSIQVIEHLDSLEHLLELNLAENFVRVIENLSPLRNLLRLNLSGNRIQRIPDSICHLKKLRTFRIARNDLRDERDLKYLRALEDLQHLRIDENPFCIHERTVPLALFCGASLDTLNGCEILPFERKAAAARFQHLDTEIITACRVAVTFHSKLREEDTETNQKVEQFDHPQRAVGSIEGQGHSAAPPSPSDNGIPSANFHSWHSIPDKGAAPAGDDRSQSMDSSLPLSGSTSDSTMTRRYDHSSPPPVAAPSILSGSSLRSDSLSVPLQRVDMTGSMPSSADTMVTSSSSATLRGVPWTRTDHVDVHDPIVASISSISSTHTPSDKHPAARTTSESPQTASRPERLEAILASPPPQPPPSKGKEHLPKSPISSLRKSHESPLNKSSLSGRSAWCGSVSLRTAPTRSTSPSPSPSKQVSALSDKVERLSERIVQVENEKTAVQAEFQRQQALQQQALQQLHMDKSKTEAVNEKLKNIIYDLQITIEDNSSDLSLLRVGEEKAKEEIDRLLEKCGKDRAAMTVIVEENTELKTRISALQKSKKSMKGILKKEISSVNVTAETYSNLKAILNRKLHLEEESMLLSADRDAGTDRDKDAGTDRDRERVTAEYASDGYGGGDVQLKIAVSIPDCGPGSSPDAALRRQSNLALREYKRALGELELLNKTLLLSRSDLHVLLEESSAAEQRLQRANSEVGDVLVLLKEKKDELREVEARRAETQGAMAITGRSKSVDEERARVEDTAERGDTRLEVGRGDTWQGSNHLLEIVRGEAERGVSEQGQRGDEQRCLEAAQSLRALQQAASEEEDRLQALQSLRADRAKSLKLGLEEMQTEMERRAEQIRAEDVCYSAMEIENTVKAKALQAEFNRLERAVEGKEEMVERLDRRIRDLALETGRLREEKIILSSQYLKIKEEVRSEEERHLRSKRENSCQVDRFQSVFLALMQKLVYVRDVSVSLDAQGDEKKEILDRLDRTVFDLQTALTLDKEEMESEKNQVLEEIDRARVRLAEVLTLLSARERDLKAADSKKGEVERECERLEEEMRMISEMLTDKKECLRDKENEMQASTAESAKCKEELKEVEISLASIYKAYEADRHREEDMKRLLNLLDTEEQDLMENQQRIKSSVDMMRSEVEDFHQEMKELDLQLEGKRRSVEEMKAEERTQIMSIEREKRKLTSIRESAAEEIALLTELRDKVTLTKTDLKSAETDLSDVTTELKFKLDEIEEHQTKFENDQTVERKKLEKGLLELERVAGMVRNEENRLFSLSAEHDTLMKEVCSLKEVESNLERSVIQLSETVRELREVISVREAEKHGLEREIYTQQMKQTIEIDKLHSLSAAIDQKNSSLTLTESDTVRAVKKLNEMKSLCKAEERIICHQRLQLKCCLDEMLVYETKLKEKAVIVRARGQGSPEVPPALRSEQESGSESGRDLKWRE